MVDGPLDARSEAANADVLPLRVVGVDGCRTLRHPLGVHGGLEPLCRISPAGHALILEESEGKASGLRSDPDGPFHSLPIPATLNRTSATWVSAKELR